MLKIGFANKYYTLWDVYDLNGYTHYDYQQNLSFNFEAAVKKTGTTDYDEFLRGESKSFKIPKKYTDLGGNTIIDFGKYAGNTLNFIVQNDYSYFEWLMGSCQNKQLRTIIYNLPIIAEKEKEKKQKEIEYYKEIANIPTFEIGSTVELTIKIETNLLFAAIYETAIYRQNLENWLTVDLLFPEVKKFWYRNKSYWLPVLNGKAKRIKGIRNDRTIRNVNW